MMICPRCSPRAGLLVLALVLLYLGLLSLESVQGQEGMRVLSPPEESAVGVQPDTTDGLPRVRMVKSIAGSAYDTASQNGNVSHLAKSSNYLFFASFGDPGNGWAEWWRSDGTPAGTQRITRWPGEIRRGGSAGKTWAYLWVQPRLGADMELWRTDGITLVTTITIPDEFVVQRDVIGANDTYHALISREMGNEGRYQWMRIPLQVDAAAKLWENPFASYYPSLPELMAAGPRAYLAYWIQTDDQRNGIGQLYTAHDTEAQPTLLLEQPAQVQLHAAQGEALYFSVTSSTASELWVSDGTITGTHTLGIAAAPGMALRAVLPQDNGFYFFESSRIADTTGETKLWHYQASPAQLRLVGAASGRMDSGIPPMHPPTLQNGQVTFLTHVPGEEIHTWWSDGQTVRRLPFAPGSSAVYPIGGKLLSFAPSEASGRELHIAEQDTARLVRDILPGPLSSLDNQYAVGIQQLVFRDILFFGATDGITGSEIWRSDGTLDGTYLLKDTNVTPYPTNPGDWYGPPAKLTPGQSKLFFVADDGRHGPRIYMTDGTESDTHRLDHPTLWTEWIEPHQLLTRGDVLYFLMWRADRQARALWRTDGTTSGTWPLKDLRGTLAMAVVNDRLVYTERYALVIDGVDYDALWRTNAADNGVELVQTFRYISCQSGSGVSDYLHAVGGLALFYSCNLNGDMHLWRTDGTTSGTAVVKERYKPGFTLPPEAVAPGETVVFYMERVAKLDGPRTWWYASFFQSDGRARGTRELGRIVLETPPPDIQSGTILHMVAAEDRLFVVYHPTNRPLELWSAHAGHAMRRLVVLGQAIDGVEPVVMTTEGGTFYLRQWLGTTMQIWRSDGTEAGTKLIGEFAAPWNSGTFMPSFLAVTPGLLYFSTQYGDTGEALFRMGSRGGDAQWTATIRAIGSTADAAVLLPIQNSSVAVMGNKLFFIGYDPQHGREVWIADPTAPPGFQLYLPSVQSSPP